MKRAVWAKAGTVEFHPLKLEDLAETEAKPVTMDKITKKKIKTVAKELKLDYDEEKLLFAKKIMTYYMTKQ